MKGKVIKRIRDKNTGCIYAPGETIERDAERFAEMNKVNGGPFIEMVDGSDIESNMGTASAEADQEAAVDKSKAAEEIANSEDVNAEKAAETESASTDTKKTRKTRTKKTEE